MNGQEKFEIVKMESVHIESILEMENLSFSIPWTGKMFLDELSNDKAFYFIALTNNRVIGYAGLWAVLDEGQITNIAVHPDYRKQGIGKCLMNKLVDICYGKGVIALTLEVRKGNLPAIMLYEGLGFVVEGIRKAYYADNGEDALIMWKKL